MSIVRSSHGIESVRQITRVSNDIAVHSLEVDVLSASKYLYVSAADGSLSCGWWRQ
jgi:hypothetical protein